MGAGKGAVCQIVKENYSGKVEIVRFSDVLRDLLDLIAIPKTRENLQNTAIYLEQFYGQGTLANAVKQRVLNIEADIVVLDGVRLLQDEQMIREIAGSKIVYVTAPETLRYERLSSRGENVGEKEMSFEEFLRRHQAQTEVNIAEIGSRADFKIENAGTEEELEKKVRDMISLLAL